MSIIDKLRERFGMDPLASDTPTIQVPVVYTRLSNSQELQRLKDTVEFLSAENAVLRQRVCPDSALDQITNLKTQITDLEDDLEIALGEIDALKTGTVPNNKKGGRRPKNWWVDKTLDHHRDLHHETPKRRAKLVKVG